MTDLTSELKELLVHMTVCASGLLSEPQIYGPLRLIDSSMKLAEIILKEEPDNTTIQKLMELIADNEEKNMTDPERFNEMLKEAVLLLVDLE